MKISDQALKVAACGGYSEDNYANWPAVAQALLDRGYSMVQAEAIMRSKWTRWAADYSGKPYGKNTSGDLLSYMDHVAATIVEVDELVATTPSNLEF